MCVIELVDDEKGEWKENLVHSIFNEEETNLIHDVPLVFSLVHGKVVLLLQSGVIEEEIWKLSCNLYGPSKLSHFLWRVYSGSFTIRERLTHRHIVDLPRCQICSHSGYLGFLDELPTTSMADKLC
ncbi:33 kDa chaperonin [Bienertia sinuspersici]